MKRAANGPVISEGVRTRLIREGKLVVRCKGQNTGLYGEAPNEAIAAYALDAVFWGEKKDQQGEKRRVVLKDRPNRHEPGPKTKPVPIREARKRSNNEKGGRKGKKLAIMLRQAIPVSHAFGGIWGKDS